MNPLLFADTHILGIGPHSTEQLAPLVGHFEGRTTSSCSQALLSNDLSSCMMTTQLPTGDRSLTKTSLHRKTSKRTLGELGE
ncbi:hypothetical protein GCK32_020238 [Trichostrongylus colubriformis]|uniref:Uncharacterized protein n=1 Tax=Trichostrongylus colubriformis TaxID=6319 RepID=A0AAN8F6E7_TRICO